MQQELAFGHRAMLVLASVGVLLVPALLPAQQSASADRGILALASALNSPVTGMRVVSETQVADPVTSTVAAGPVVTQSGIVRAVAVDATTALSLQNGTYSSNRTDVAWMGVGAAALVIGLLIGGDAGSVVAITGGVIGLVGLFRYLN